MRQRRRARKSKRTDSIHYGTGQERAESEGTGAGAVANRHESAPGSGGCGRVTRRLVNRSAAQHGADSLGSALHRGVACRARVVFGQRAIRCAEPQREGQRFSVVPDLRAGKDVEQLQILQQISGTVSDGIGDHLCRDVGGHHQAEILEHRGKG